MTRNRAVVVVALVLYIFFVLTTWHWGIPGQRGVFTYQVDEWHQLMSVRNLAEQWTVNVAGAANGPIFHFLQAGMWITPAVLFGSIDLSSITSPVVGLAVQEDIFKILRLNTLSFGIATLLLASAILKKYYTATNTLIVLWATAPFWVVLSTYFKYDIALLFWITLAFGSIHWFMDQPTQKRYIIAGAVLTVAIATKVTAAPLVVPYIVAFFLAVPNWKAQFYWLTNSAAIQLILFSCIGIPDIIFLAKGEYLEFFSSNIVTVPQTTANFILPGGHYLLYILTHQLPFHFGWGLVIFTLGSIAVWAGFGDKSPLTSREKVSLVSLFSMAVSLLPLQLYMVGNRMLVLLPLIIFVVAILIRRIQQLPQTMVTRMLWRTIVVSAVGLQLFHLESVLQLRWNPDPRAQASAMVQKYIPAGSTIGVENIPIYQMLPDVITTDFYTQQYYPGTSGLYNYTVLTEGAQSFPEYVIVTNGLLAAAQQQSPKKDLINQLSEQGYVQISVSRPAETRHRLFGTHRDLFISGLFATPTDITLYRRQ